MKKRWRRLRYVLAAVALLALLAALAPSAANWGPVRTYVEGRLAEALGRPVTVGELRAGWGSGVRLAALEVGNAGAEFAGPGLLEARSIRVEDPLLGLLFGDGPSRVRVEGLVLRVEEQAGGRTNLDDLLQRLAEAPPRPPEEPPPPPRPLSIELADCTFELKRLPRRDVAPVDPFVEDPEILPADAGSWRLGVERFDLVLQLGPGATEIEFDGGVTVNGKGGALEGALRVAGDDVTGHAKATGVDLSLAEPFLGRPIAGSLDLEVKGGSGGAVEVHARVRGVAAEGVAEDWVTLAAAGRRDGDALQVDRMTVATASGRLAVDAAGRWPPEEGADFRLGGRADLRLLAELHARAPREGVVTFAVEGTRTDAGADVRGTAAAKGLVFPDPELARAGPMDLDATFDAAWDGETVTIRSLTAKEERLDVFVRGTVAPDVLDLTGHAEADLARMGALLAPMLPEGARVRGDVRLEAFHIRREAAGDVAVQAEGVLERFRASGLVEGEELSCDHGVLELDADLTAGGDVLTVRRGRFNDLEATGRVAGLRREQLESAEGTVRGTVELTPLLLKLAGTDALQDLRGRATLDVKGTTGKDGGVAAEGRVDLVDLFVRGSFGEVRQPMLALSGRAAQAGGSTTADVTFRAERFDGTLKVERLTKEAQAGTVTLNVADLAEVPDLVPGFAWPEGGWVRGAASVHAQVSREKGVFTVSGDLQGTGVTARFEEYGFDDDAVVGMVRAARDGAGGWSVPTATLALKRRGVALAVKDGHWTSADGFGAAVRVEGPLDALASVVPDLQAYGPRGKAVVEARVDRGAGATAIDADAAVDGFAARVGGREVTSKKLVLKARGRVDGDAGAVEQLRLALDRAWVEAKGTLGAATELKVRAGGELDAVAPFVPKLDGMGPFTADATVTAGLDLPGRALVDGPVSARGFVEGKRVAYDGAQCEDGRVEFQVGARRAGAD